MKRTSKLAAITATVTAVGVIAASPAFAISRVSAQNCATRNDYFTVTSSPNGARVCFANSGSASVALYNVEIVQAGNNTGYFDYVLNGVSHNGVVFSRGSTPFSGSGAEVTFIHID